jgi:hypothetical protein
MRSVTGGHERIRPQEGWGDLQRPTPNAPFPLARGSHAPRSRSTCCLSRANLEDAVRVSTAEIHEQIVVLGRSLGFEPTREVGGTVLTLRLDDAYLPRADVLWSLRLSNDQAGALSTVTGASPSRLLELPIVGIEIEGTTPTTKTMAADVANIAALGTRLGLLVVSEEGERGIYRRAARTIRTLRRSFGDLVVLPLEASWLEGLARQKWSVEVCQIAPKGSRAPAGGESLAWSTSTRRYLRELGERAGFVVAEPYTPDVLTTTFNEEQDRRPLPLEHMIDPVARKSAPMKKAGDYLTACQIDLAWLLPLPSGLRELLVEVARLDPNLRDHGVLYPELHGHVAVVGFELESSGGKHAAGGLLNLAAYCVVGIGVSPTAAQASELEAVLARYRPTLGLRNVRVLVHS